MDLIRINEVVDHFGVSSRTLRYYEETGLIWSSHPENKTQRYYNAAALERLKQILILRKLQIPIKDISAIFKSESTAALIQAFVDKLESLDTEITALSELRRLLTNSGLYAHDPGENNDAPRHEMIEEILPWDIANRTGRYQQDVFIPIK